MNTDDENVKKEEEEDGSTPQSLADKYEAGRNGEQEGLLDTDTPKEAEARQRGLEAKINADKSTEETKKAAEENEDE